MRRDLRKLGLFAEAHLARGSNPLATYMVVLDNHRREEKPPTSWYRRDRMTPHLERLARDWPESAPIPVVLVATKLGVDRYENFTV